MKKFILSLFLSLFSLVIFKSTIWAQTETIDQINNFHSEITINKDTSISIVETLQYETNLVKHGIYRYIPYRYVRDMASFTAQIKDIKITDENGKKFDFTKNYEGNFLMLKIGSADITFTGKKTYIISYQVENALRRFEGYDELFWDIVGDGWQIPVLQSDAVIKSSFARIDKIDCFSGVTGSNDKLCVSNFTESQSNFVYDQEINYGSNMTAVLALSQNDSQIAFPTQTQIMIKQIKDNFVSFLFAVPAVIMFLIWRKKGRDLMFVSPNIYNMDKSQPQKFKSLFFQDRTPFHYEPIRELTPGEAGAIFDEKVDNRDVIAEIIDLARKKYLKLEKVEKKVFLGKSTDYKFTKLKEVGTDLPTHQEYLLNHIFSGGNTEVMLSDLKGTFHTHMQTTKEMINKSLTTKKLYTRNPAAKWLAVVLVVAIYGFLFFLSLGLAVSYGALPNLISLVSGIIALIFALGMTQKSAVGNNFMLQAKGLAQMIKYGKWREEIAEKNLFIQEVLPFAIALGVVKQLAKDMEKLNIEPPQYFNNTVLQGMALSNFVDSFSKQAVSTMTYNPSSSNWSSGSGFSGGGSSGGGGGGGGGGSW